MGAPAALRHGCASGRAADGHCIWVRVTPRRMQRPCASVPHCSFGKAVRLRLPSCRWEDLGASEQSGRCPQLPSVSYLCRSSDAVIFFVRGTRTFFLFLSLFFFSWLSMTPISSCSRYRFLISSLMLPSPSPCSLWPGFILKIKCGMRSATSLQSFWVDAAVLAFAACIALSRACSRTAAYLLVQPSGYPLDRLDLRESVNLRE